MAVQIVEMLVYVLISVLGFTTLGYKKYFIRKGVHMLTYVLVFLQAAKIYMKILFYK